MRDLKKQLTGLKDAKRLYGPDKTWVEKNRGLLLSQIRNTVSTEQVSPSFLERWTQALHVVVPQSAMRAARPVMSVFLILSLTVAGWITTASASNSLPGDLLWNVKIAQEKTETVITDITGSPKKQTEVHLKHAARRAQEIKQVTNTQKPEAAKKVKIATDQLKQSLESANKTVGEVHKKSPDDVMGAIKEFSAVTSEISITLEETSTKLELSEDTKQSATETTRAVQKSSLDAVGLLMNGDAATSAETKEVIGQKIGSVLDTVERSSATQARSLVVEQGVASSTPTTSTPRISGSEATAEVVPPPSISPTVDPEAVRVLSQEIKVLLEENKLTEALEKTKELIVLQGGTTATPAPATSTTTPDVSVQAAPTSSTPSASTSTKTP